MNIQEAKNIRLVDFLAGFGHEPVIQRGNSVWYKSPFRTEKEASFKVDLHKELWYDFGLGKGGDIITLAKEIYQTQDVSRVLRCIEDKRTVLKPVTVSCPFEKAYPAFQDLKIIPLANRILLAYLEERCIDTETARKVCKEAHFNRNGKNYFAIAFPNISGGYEIRNRYFKACIAPKDISRIISSPESGICYIFEGFMDFLSFRRKYSINSLVYWVTYVHNVVYSFYRSMIYCYINSTQRCAGSIVIDIIPTNGADKRKFFPFAPYFPVTNVIKRYFYPYFPAIIGIKGYSFPYFPYLSGIMKIKTALYSLFSRLDWHKTVVFPCLGEIYEGIRSLSWEIPVT